jgi:predicted homoserine dehydrogenase-like protein
MTMAWCKLTRDIKKDTVLSYDDIELPPDRLADRLRGEQYRHFRGAAWLEALVGGRV